MAARLRLPWGTTSSTESTTFRVSWPSATGSPTRPPGLSPAPACCP